MLWSALAFAGGVLLLQLQPELPAWGRFGLLALPVLPVLLVQRAGWARGLLCLLAFAAGFSWACWRAELRLAEALPVDMEGQDVELVGVVAGLPQQLGGGVRFEFAVEVFGRNLPSTAGFSPPGRILLSCYAGRGDGEQAACPALRPGQRWRWLARLKRPHGHANPWAFDYEAWLLERGIRATGYLRSGERVLLDDFVLRPMFAIERLRESLRERFRRVLPEEDYPWGGILVALTIGDQRAIAGDYWNVFNRSGVTHLMSISGLHVTMVAALLAALVGGLWRRQPQLALRLPAQRAAVVAGFLAALGYALLAGFAVPAQRTVYMLGVAALALLARRQPAPSHTLALALLVVLLADPWAVLAAGFWLSFAAVAALLYAGAALVGSDGRGWRTHLVSGLRTQWAATLASLPVLLLVFQQFSLVSPLANAVAIPLVSFLVTPLALLGAVLPWPPILQLAHALLDGLMFFLNWCATWPVWQAPVPPLWAVLVAALGIALLLLPRGVPGRWGGAFLLLPLLLLPAEVPPAGTARLSVLDVGQGLATVVQTRSHLLVFDPGPLYGADSDAGQRVLLPYLRALGSDRVDRLVLSHRDSDHVGGAASLLAALPVDEVLASWRLDGTSPCRAGLRWRWDGVDFAFLHPGQNPAVDGENGNDFSCVLKVSAGGQAALLTADIEAAAEAELLRRDAAALAAEVLVVAHHGSRSSSSAPFLAAVGARAALIPVGYRNRFGHPSPLVLERLAAVGSEVWRSDRDGALRVDLGAGALAVRAWRREHRRYWHGR